MDELLRVHGTDGFDLSLPVAGLGGRAYAFAIDWHIRLLLAAAWLLAGLAVARWVPTTAPSDWIGSEVGALHYLIAVPPLAIYFLYHPVLEVWMRGRTPGKRMTGLRIVTLTGATPGVGSLLMRNLFRLVDSLPAFYLLGMLMVAATRRHVRIGDLAAGTLLVYERGRRGAGLDALYEAYAGDSPLSLERVALVQELLARWDGLTPEVRERLGRALLGRLGLKEAAQTREGLGEAALRAQLVALLPGAGTASRG